MRVYWQAVKQGLRLMLVDGERDERLGGVRTTPRGFDAFATTFGYDPDRARRGIASQDEAKAFVESLKPWELFVRDSDISVESEIESPGG